MARYIDSEKIKLTSMTWIDGGQDVLVPLVSVKKAIAQTPTEDDVVKVTRCKNCVYREPLDHQRYNYKNKQAMYCSWHNRITKEYGFCDEGKPKETNNRRADNEQR